MLSTAFCDLARLEERKFTGDSGSFVWKMRFNEYPRANIKKKVGKRCGQKRKMIYKQWVCHIHVSLQEGE
jgi:hypothetical protein